MSKKSCPVFVVYSIYKNGQDFFDISAFLGSIACCFCYQWGGYKG